MRVGQLDFAIARNYDAEVQVMGMEIEGIDITVLFPCISMDYPHFDSNFPNVSNNLLCTVPRDIAAQIFMGGAHLYGFTDADFEKADAAAAARDQQLAAPVGD